MIEFFLGVFLAKSRGRGKEERIENIELVIDCIVGVGVKYVN